MSGRMGGVLRYYPREHEGPEPHVRTKAERDLIEGRLERRRLRKTAAGKRTYNRHK